MATPVPLSQNSFGGGEWAESAQGASDDPKYRESMKVSHNALPNNTRAHVRRSGFRLVGTTRCGLPAGLKRFRFSNGHTYYPEFSDQVLRFWEGANIVTTNDDRGVVSISSASPALVTTDGPHGWVTFNQVIFDDLENDWPELQGRMFIATVTGADTFTMTDSVTNAPFDGSTLTSNPNPPTAPIVKRVLEMAANYVQDSSNDWQNLRIVQVQAQVQSKITESSILLNGAEPKILTVESQPTDSVFADFDLQPQNFKDGPYLDPFPTSIASPSAVTGNITLTLSFTAYSATKSYSVGDYATDTGVHYRSLQNSNLNNTPASSPASWVIVTGGDAIGPAGFTAAHIGSHVRMQQGVNWTWGRITAVSGTGIINGTISGSTNIGDMNQQGGLAAAFDGTNSKAQAASACSTVTSTLYGPGGSGAVTKTSYIGKNYTGAGAQAIQYVTLYPTTDASFMHWVRTLALSLTATPFAYFYLFAKQTAPAHATDGFELGQVGTPHTGSPVTIVSVDQTTAWNYVWVTQISHFQYAVSPGFFGHLHTINNLSQAVFYSPNVANGSVATVQIAGPDLADTTPLESWRLGLYGGAIGWPTCGTWTDGRLWLSGAVKNRVDASRSNEPFTFSPTTVAGVVQDSSAIAYTFNSEDLNDIHWMEPIEDGILCGTQAGEWVVQATNLNLALTPTNIQARRRTKVKCADIEPVTTPHTTVMVQAGRERLMEIFPDVLSGRMPAPDLTDKAPHITSEGVVEIDYQQDPVPALWGRDDAGKLFGVTYRREKLHSKEGPEVLGWHRHTLGHERFIESLAVGRSLGGNLDTVALVTNDPSVDPPVRHVEMMADLFEETSTVYDCAFLDGAIYPKAYKCTSTGLVIYGLHLLEGKEVTVFAGGLDLGEFTVTDAKVTVPFQSGAGDQHFTEAFVDHFGPLLMPLQVGHCYTSQGQILTPEDDRRGLLLGVSRRSSEYAMKVVKTRGISVGTDFDNLKPVLFKMEGVTPIKQGELFSGVHRAPLNDSSSYDGALCWQADRPYPFLVTAIRQWLATH